MISRDRVSSIRRARDGIYGRNPVFYCLLLRRPVALDSAASSAAWLFSRSVSLESQNVVQRLSIKSL